MHRSLSRSRLVLLSAGILLVVSAGGVSAAKPTRGCPDGFQRWDILDFRDYSNSAEFLATLPPEGLALAPDILAEINSQAWLDGLDGLDKNDDGAMCAKRGPINAGHLYGWIWNVVDNTANS
jgi:hypothetical protein